MLNLFFCIIVVFLAYLGDEKVTRDKNMRLLVRSFLVIVLSLHVMQMPTTDRPGYFYFYENEAWYYGVSSFQDLLDWLSFDSMRMEIGFTYICKLFRFFGFSSSMFYFIIAIVTNTMAMNVLYKFKYPAIVFFLFYLSLPYIQEANLIRQMLTVMIGLYATRYIEEKQWKKYLLIIIVLFSIHRSSFFLVFLMPLMFIKEDHEKKVNIVLLALWVISFAFVFKLIPSIDFLTRYFMETRYQNYLATDIDVGSRDAKFNPIYNLLVLFYFICYKKSNGLIVPTYFVLGCVVSNMAIAAGQTFVRMALYFLPMYSAFVPTLLSDNKWVNNRNKQTKSVILALLVLYYIRQMLRGL